MDIISQNAYHRQRMLKYFESHTAEETAVRYKVSRKTVYKWEKRYDGTLESLKDRSRRPLHSPKGHTEKEINPAKSPRNRNRIFDFPVHRVQTGNGTEFTNALLAV